MILKKLYNHFNTARPCHNCGCNDFDHVTQERIDYIECEYSLNCRECGSMWNYWSYGNFELPTRRLDFFFYLWRGYRFQGLKVLWNNILDSFWIIFRKEKSYLRNENMGNS